MLTPKQISFLREELKTAKNPLFIHDDDADGLASFLLLYKLNREGRNFILKTTSKLDASFVEKAKNYDPDKIFILDVPVVEQEFIDQIKMPVFWLDHHQPLERGNIYYCNPRLKEPQLYEPTTIMAWQVSQQPEDLWIAVVGCLGDYYLPDFLDQFIQGYPQWIARKGELSQIAFGEPVHKLVRLFNFLLKGPTSEIRKSVKVLSRINSPDEIFSQETSQGRFLYKRFTKIDEKYESLLEEAKKRASRSKLFIFYYTEQQWSFTASLANELSYLYPGKVIIIARKKSEEMKCSLRARENISIPLEKALAGIDGYGGGHEMACGAVIKEHDWERFLENFKRELRKEELRKRELENRKSETGESMKKEYSEEELRKEK